MCGISGSAGSDFDLYQLYCMLDSLSHRGPDDNGVYADGLGASMAHNRLSIIDLEGGHQPMVSANGRYVIVYNGEIYNYLELRAKLDYPWQTNSDTEVILAAWEQWGAACLEQFVGMFAFAIWDRFEERLFLARDRFGVKPLYYALHNNRLYFASEIKALWAAGIPREPDERAWARYLAHGLYDAPGSLFWRHINRLEPGHYLDYPNTTPRCWYNLSERITEEDGRAEDEVKAEYMALLRDAVRLRFRADVPVGINLSGGLDSSVLLALVDELHPNCAALTFTTNSEYDEARYIAPFIGSHPWQRVTLTPHDAMRLAEPVANSQDEPYGGLPTLAYAALFAASPVKVLLDGNGMDEQWAGYDYYSSGARGQFTQGSRDSAVRPNCLPPAFRALAGDLAPGDASGSLRAMQVRDITRSKLPRALRFNDRISMRVGVELRSPFMDHRLIELALRQPDSRKIQGGVQKWLLRAMAADLLPGGVAQAPKRAVQTPQREWLRGPMRAWAGEHIERALQAVGGCWLDAGAVRREWSAFLAGKSDNSFYVWQWISVGMMICEP